MRKIKSYDSFNENFISNFFNKKNQNELSKRINVYQLLHQKGMNLTSDDFLDLDPKTPEIEILDAFKTAYLRGDNNSQESLKTLLNMYPYNRMEVDKDGIKITLKEWTEEVDKSVLPKGTINTNPNRPFGPSNYPPIERRGGIFFK